MQPIDDVNQEPITDEILYYQAKLNLSLKAETGTDFIDEIARWQLAGSNKPFGQPDSQPKLADEAMENQYEEKTDDGKPKPLLIFDEKPLHNYDDSNRRINYVDSSIWCRYADKNNLEAVKNSIKKYHDWGLYDMVEAKELLDFNARLVEQSYLREIEEGRSLYVVPFVFHEEGQAVRSLKSVKARINAIRGVKKLRWRIMLVDDGLTGTGGEVPTRKARIIHAILSQDFSVSCHGLEDMKSTEFPIGEIELICVPFERLLNTDSHELFNQRYDLVLLDFAFSSSDRKPTYSYDLLTKINDGLNGDDGNEREEWSSRKGISGRFWFFHISSFSAAIEERLQEKGFSHHTEDWHIARGACPIVTPELFRYNLTRFMLRQIEIVTRLPLHTVEKSKSYIVTLVDLLDEIFFTDHVRTAASRYFNVVLELRARYGMLKEDLMFVSTGKSSPSPLITALFPDVRDYSNSFWEHLTHLLYHIAYGTVLQWTEMWQELLFVKPILDRGEMSCRGEKSLSSRIEKYIIDLKKGRIE